MCQLISLLILKLRFWNLYCNYFASRMEQCSINLWERTFSHHFVKFVKLRRIFVFFVVDRGNLVEIIEDSLMPWKHVAPYFIIMAFVLLVRVIFSFSSCAVRTVKNYLTFMSFRILRDARRRLVDIAESFEIHAILTCLPRVRLFW